MPKPRFADPPSAAARLAARGAATVAVLVMLPAAAWAAASITGTVTSDGAPVAGVTVYVAQMQAETDAGGRYTIDPAPGGTQTVVVFKEGYRTVTETLDVPAAGAMTRDFSLEPDLLYSDSVTVTGTRNPLTKRESSVAITTLTQGQIDERAPRSTADLLKVVPGFYVESSGGEVGGNLFARGMPADGSYRYVALMEDGMPVYDATELSFVNADIFVRVDETLQEVEAVRGGNSALFGSNAPGGVINFISHTGGAEPQTRLKLTTGTDGLWRAGFNTGGPLAESWTYDVGGFYRYDEGVRDPGFPASQGGQIKFNLTRTLDTGFVRVYGKYLNDQNIFYLPLPFRAGGDLSYVDGFPFEGTLTTPEGNQVTVPRPNQNGRLTLPLDEGQRQEEFAFTGEISVEIGDGWLLHNMARAMDMDHSWNAVVPFDLVGVDDFADGFTPPGGSAQYSFTNHDEAFSTVNDLLLTAGLWHIEKPMTSVANQLELSHHVDSGGTGHDISVGTYVSHYTADNVWYFNDILTDVKDQPRFVDLTVFDAAGHGTQITENGFRRYGSLFVNATGNVDVMAIFAGDTISIGDKLRVDLGGRWESNDFRQTEENTANFDLGGPSQADDAVGGGTGTFRRVEQSFDEWAFSAGVNYLVSDRLAVWGRGSRGYKMPNLDNYLFGGGDLEAEGILQVEGGIKLGTPTYGLNASAYFLQVSDFPSQDVRVVNGQTVFVTEFVGEAETLGLETELVAQPCWLEGCPVRASLSATFQQPEYTDFTEDGDDLSGNRVRRIPEVIGDLTVGWYRPQWSAAANVDYIGDRFSNNANTIELPAFDVWTFTGTYDLTEDVQLELAVLNAFQSNGLTEGNPRLDEGAAAAGVVFLARPVLPRRVTLSLDFRF
jgi:outer membrane receptor protein involved in Fe transport